MFLQPSKTTVFQIAKSLPLGKYFFNLSLSMANLQTSSSFSPYVVNLKPMYCETLIHLKKAYKNSAGYFKHGIILQLCDYTFNLALDSQSKLISTRRPYKVEMELLKETNCQISAICDLQDQSEKNRAKLIVHDINGDQIAIACFYLSSESSPNTQN